MDSDGAMPCSCSVALASAGAAAATEAAPAAAAAIAAASASGWLLAALAALAALADLALFCSDFDGTTLKKPAPTRSKTRFGLLPNSKVRPLKARKAKMKTLTT